MFIYLQQIWETISLNQDLNIPNQKIMVSTYRCNEVKNGVLDQSMSDFNDLRKDLSQNKGVNLRERYNEIIEKSVLEFQNNTKFYDEEIAEKGILELKTKLNKEFESVFKV